MIDHNYCIGIDCNVLHSSSVSLGDYRH